MLEHVLVPLDGSQLGEEAVHHAKKIVSPDGQITLVSAVEMPEIPLYGFDLVGVTSAPSYQATLEDIVARANTYLENIAEELKSEGFQAKFIVQFGDPPSVIVDLAAQYNVDAIVMSTHGRSGISRWLFGSVTNKVLGMATCPVLVIPSEHRQRLLEPETTGQATS